MVDLKKLLGALGNLNPIRIPYGQETMILEFLRDSILLEDPKEWAKLIRRIMCKDKELRNWIIVLIMELVDKECAKKLLEKVVSGEICRKSR